MILGRTQVLKNLIQPKTKKAALTLKAAFFNKKKD
jgi:hypothetical protein